MACSDNGAQPAGSPADVYALVSYIPDPLGSFIDELRRELVPACIPHAHVTILPPRKLQATPEKAWSQIQAIIQDLPPFIIEPDGVRQFDVTSVIYLEILRGERELRSMHDLLNRDGLSYKETYEYHPHITVAQGIMPGEVESVKELARQKWAQCPYKAPFPVETVTFVQNMDGDRWIDLAQCTLGAVPIVR